MTRNIVHRSDYESQQTITNRVDYDPVPIFVASWLNKRHSP